MFLCSWLPLRTSTPPCYWTEPSRLLYTKKGGQLVIRRFNVTHNRSSLTVENINLWLLRDTQQCKSATGVKGARHRMSLNQHRTPAGSLGNDAIGDLSTRVGMSTRSQADHNQSKWALFYLLKTGRCPEACGQAIHHLWEGWQWPIELSWRFHRSPCCKGS